MPGRKACSEPRQNHSGSIYLEKTLGTVVKKQYTVLDKEQHGFRPGKSTVTAGVAVM